MLRWLYKVWRCSITPAFNTALMCPVFLSGVCIVRVKTRRLILAGNDPASPLYIYTASCCFVSPVYPGFSQRSLTSGSPLGCKTVCVVVRALCQLPTRMSVKHSLSGDTGSYRRLHWGQTRQKIHSSLWWPYMWYFDVIWDCVVFEVKRLRQKTQLPVLRISALKHHDKWTKPKLWSWSSIITMCVCPP